MAEQITTLLKAGQALGYEGIELQRYIEKTLKEVEEREERANKREQDRLDREIATKKLEQDRLEKEIEKKRLEIEAASLNTCDTKTERTNIGNYHKLPKLPNFNPNLDELDAYITRFESLADQAKWSELDKFTALSNLLTGDTLQVLYNLPPEEKNYISLKNALFVRYKYTEDGFRERFRNYKPAEGLDFKTFVNSLRTFLNKYVEASKIEKSFDQLMELIMKEQIYNICNPQLVTFLKKRNPKNISELIGLAEIFSDTHPNVKLGKTESFSSANVTNQNQGQNSNYQNRTNYQPRNNPSRGTSTSRFQNPTGFRNSRPRFRDINQGFNNNSQTSQRG